MIPVFSPEPGFAEDEAERGPRVRDHQGGARLRQDSLRNVQQPLAVRPGHPDGGRWGRTQPRHGLPHDEPVKHPQEL